MDHPSTPNSLQDIYSSMIAIPPTDRLSLDPEPSKPHKTTAKKHTDSDEHSKEPDPQDPNEAKQRLRNELLALLEPDDNVKRLKDSQTHLSNIWTRHNKLSKPEDHSPPHKNKEIEEKEDKGTLKLPKRPTEFNLHTLPNYLTLKPKEHIMHMLDHTTVKDTPHDTFSIDSNSNPSNNIQTSVNTTRTCSQGQIYDAINDEHNYNCTYLENCCQCISWKEPASKNENTSQPCLPCQHCLKHKQPKRNCLTIYVLLTTTAISLASLTYTSTIFFPQWNQ